MAKSSEVIDSFKLANSESGKIEVAVIKEPYGEESKPVASIGIFLDDSGSEPNWKAHIPKDNIDDIINALQKAKELL